MKIAAFIIAFAASFLPDEIVAMNFVTSLIVSTIVFYVVYKGILKFVGEE